VRGAHAYGLLLQPSLVKRSRNVRSDFEGTASILDAALEDLGGAAIVLDSSLAVVRATPRALALVGTDLPVGVSAPRLLCGGATNRPIAEALARGVPVTGTIHRPALTKGEPSPWSAPICQRVSRHRACSAVGPPTDRSPRRWRAACP